MISNRRRLAWAAVAIALGWVWFRFGHPNREGQAPGPQAPHAASVSGVQTEALQPGSRDVPKVGPMPGAGKRALSGLGTAGDVPGGSSVGSTRPQAASPPSTESLDQFRDPRIPLNERLGELARLGRKRDEASAKTLMAVGDARMYVNRYAVEALGGDRSPEVRTYLSGKLWDPDSMMACAAIRALGRSAGAEAVPALEEALLKNRERPDGHDELVCTAAVETLGLVGSDTAVPALSRELDRSEGKDWNLEYGSAVVKALTQLNNAPGLQAISAYADRLSSRLPQDPWPGSISRGSFARRGRRPVAWRRRPTPASVGYQGRWEEVCHEFVPGTVDAERAVVFGRATPAGSEVPSAREEYGQAGGTVAATVWEGRTPMIAPGRPWDRKGPGRSGDTLNGR